jgi:hypothetical protein
MTKGMDVDGLGPSGKQRFQREYKAMGVSIFIVKASIWHLTANLKLLSINGMSEV